MATIGSLNIELRANTTRFVQGMETAGKRLKRFRGNAKKLTGTILNVKTALLGLAGAAGFGMLIKSSFAANDSLAKTADKLGLTTEALAGMRHAAELSGVETRTLDMAIQRMTRRLSEAAMGTGEAKAALKELGLDAQKLSAMGPDQAFHKIAAAMENVTTQGDRVRLSFKLFDSEGVALVNTLALGEKGLSAAAKEAQELGIAVSRFDASKIEAANDAFTRAGAAVKGIANNIAINLAPHVAALADYFTDAAKSSNGFKEEVLSGSKSIVMGIGHIGNMFRGLSLVWKGLQDGFALFAEGLLVNINNIAQGLVSLRQYFDEDYQPPLFVQVLNSAAQEAINRTAQLKVELETLALTPMPTETITAFFDNIETRANEHAAKIVNVHQKKNAALVKNQVKSNKALDKFNKMTWQNQTKHVVGELINMKQGVAQHSKTMFKINKVAGIANAIINTYQGVTNALAAYPPPLSFAMAAAQLAAGLAQVSAIKSTSFGGGGSAPSLAGSPGTPVTPVQNNQVNLPEDQLGQPQGIQEIHITIDGVLPTDPDILDDLAKSIADNMRNGGQSPVAA